MRFEDLVGGWDLDRVLEPGLGRFTGTARFAPIAPGVLHYREQGELRLSGGWSGPAQRDQLWVLDGARLRVHLVDRAASDPPEAGAVLHELAATVLHGDPAPAAVHHCAADTYTGTYRVRPPDLIEVGLVVRGPAKDYRTDTTLRRRMSR